MDISNYKMGQAVTGQATLRAGVTSPPSYFTDGELVGMMENIAHHAGLDSASTKILKAKSGGNMAGIGTARTRSTIIKGLLERELIEFMPSKKSKSKKVCPTQKGRDIIVLLRKVAPQLTSPDLTAKWEEALAMIERGEVTLEQFMVKQNDFCRKIIGAIKESAPKRGGCSPSLQNALPGDGDVCPRCGKNNLSTKKVLKVGSKHIGKRFLSCADRACGHIEGDFVE